MSGGMRQRPIDYVLCPVCPADEDGEPAKHPAVVRMNGWPVLACPSVKSDALRYREGWSVILTGATK